MKKIFLFLNKTARKILSFAVRVFLGLAYLFLILPFAVAVRMRTDYLEIKTKEPSWIPLPRVSDQKQMLAEQ